MGLLIIKAGGIYSYHWALKGQFSVTYSVSNGLELRILDLQNSRNKYWHPQLIEPFLGTFILTFLNANRRCIFNKIGDKKQHCRNSLITAKRPLLD